MKQIMIYHVTSAHDGWKAKVEGGERSSLVKATKAEAVEATISLAKKAVESSVVVHKKNGQFQEERTYPKSSDPFPPRG